MSQQDGRCDEWHHPSDDPLSRFRCKLNLGHDGDHEEHGRKWRHGVTPAAWLDDKKLVFMVPISESRSQPARSFRVIVTPPDDDGDIPPYILFTVNRPTL